MIRLTFLMILLTAFGSGAAWAADEKKQAAEAQAKSTPITEWVAAENKLIDTLSQKDKEAFYVMRNKHGILRSVRVVSRDVGKAVKACGKANPDMKKTMDGRFTDWKNAVHPILDTAEKFLNEEIDAQKVVFPSDFRYILKMNDKAFEFSEKQIEKEPVTSAEACRSLLDSMDRTEDDLIELLQDALLPEEVIRQRIERAEEAKKKAQ
jgi:hypothetical protein